VSINVARLRTAPVPTNVDPYAQIRWMFYQLEGESGEAVADNLRYARSKYISFLKESGAGYEDLLSGELFYLVRHWEADALIRFNGWLIQQELASKTKYSLYKSVRAVMDLAYGLRIIDTMVYHAPMFKGVSETDERAAYSDIEQGVINAALARWIGLAGKIVFGYTPTGAGVPYRVKSNACIVKQHSISAKPLEKNTKSLPEKLSNAAAVEVRGARAVIIAGVSFPSISKAAEAYGVATSVANQRLRSGASLEQAFGIVPFRVAQSDDRALLWAFENVYGCDAKAMMSDFHARKIGVVCTEKRMRTLFARWGVWPYVDDRLVMPLAVELAMLTALNVESIKDLETDCFQASHPLTGQPVLYYYKLRAAGPLRSAERVLHLPLLDKEELHLDQAKMEKVARLIALILDITSKIRPNAGAFSTKLFIFQDIELSRKSGKDMIVPIEPKGKAGHWYSRFMREECLNEILGESFRFNIARCRPTAATNLLLSGASIFQVQAVLDHKNLQTTAGYLDERRLTPVFNQTMSDALVAISSRSKAVIKIHPILPTHTTSLAEPQFADTLSGCGCGNPHDPSEDVRKQINFKQGSVCKHWNMCLFCSQSVITQRSLPKLILYRNRVSSALQIDSVAIRFKKNLLNDVIQLIDSIISEQGIFPANVVDEAHIVAAALDDILVDQLLYQGL
jgi:hypothetical protein